MEPGEPHAYPTKRVLSNELLTVLCTKRIYLFSKFWSRLIEENTLAGKRQRD